MVKNDCSLQKLQYIYSRLFASRIDHNQVDNNQSMQTAIFSSSLLILIAYILIRQRPRFAGFTCLNAGGVQKEEIVKIEKRLAHFGRRKSCSNSNYKILEMLSKKLYKEIHIFNSMKLVMVCRRKVPVIYSQFLGRLIIEPRWVIHSDTNKGSRDDAIMQNDGFLRFLYICAAMNLYANSKDSLIKRQLLKNCIYVFGQRDIIKIKRTLIRTQRNFSVYKGHRFKYLGGRFVFKRNRVDRPSYTVFELEQRDEDGNKIIPVKTYSDRCLPVQCFETNAQRFSYYVGEDKFQYNLAHTSDTFFATKMKNSKSADISAHGQSEAIGVYVPEKVAFGSSLCEAGNDLNLYASSECGKYYVIHGKTKSEISDIVMQLKRRRGVVDYLLPSEEQKEISLIESLFEQAWYSRFVYGDRLKAKFSVACKYVPTLFLPSLVYIIEKQDDFFAVVDKFGLLRKIAKTGNNLNIIFLYSGINDEVREIVKAFVDREAARELITEGVFLFFIDRINIESDALNYMTLMSEAAKIPNRLKISSSELNPRTALRANANNKTVEVITHISKSFPITHNVYIRNKAKSMQRAHVSIPLCIGSELQGLEFGIPSICRRQGGLLHITSLKSGKNSNYKLPNGASVTDEFGREITEGEIACEKVFICCEVKLACFEEKKLIIVKGEGTLSRSERKQVFIGSLQGVCVKGDYRLQRLFEIKITDVIDEKFEGALKNAIKNFDRDVFFALLKNREEISADVYSLLIEKVIGIKLLRGKIQLLPCIAVTGNFELSFTYNNDSYNFKVVERGGGFTINYGDSEYKNFFELPITAKAQTR